MSKTKIFLISFVIFITFAFLVYDNPQISSFEMNIINLVQGLLKNIPVFVPKFITSFGHETSWLYVAGCACLIMAFFKKFKAMLFFIFSLPIAEYLYSSVKLVVDRPRPPVDFRLIEISNTSFPSGHSMLSMVTYGLLIYFVIRYVKNETIKNALILILSSIILLVGFSRVWLGVHYPTDVLGGYSLGVCFICFVAYLYSIKIKNPFAKKEKNEN